MEIGSQIRKYRSRMNLSQDELAEKIFVTRQTISNWENGKNYPDIKSLLLLSSLFDISLDILVKGDLEEMKKQIETEDLKQFNRDAAILAVMMLVLLISPIPLGHFFGWFGLVIYAVIIIVALYFAIRVEKHKKKHDIQTYKEILAFSEGKNLDETAKKVEIGKRPYQKVLLALGAGLIALAVMGIMIAIFTLLG